jgi:hypothetical protein
VSARLILAAPEDQHCLQEPGGPRKDCSVVEAARAAFSAMTSRLFTSRPRADLDLILTVDDVLIANSAAGGLNLKIWVRALVLTPGGEVLDEIRTDGEASITEDAPVKSAAMAAAGQAARRFEGQYARSAAISSYLVGNKIAPDDVDPPARSDQVVTTTAGLGLAVGSGDSAVSTSFSFGASLAWRFLFAQVAFARSSPRFEGGIQTGTTHGNNATLETNDLGLELGWVQRFPHLDLRVGGGLHYLLGSAQFDAARVGAEDTYHKLSPAAFASVSVPILPYPSAYRFVVGVEARFYFLADVTLPDMARSPPAANSAFGLFIGGEFPWGKRAP